MAQLVMQAMTACPDSAVVMGGYSQGGQLVHNAAAMLPPAMAAKVSSGMPTLLSLHANISLTEPTAVIFGDPMNGKPVAGVPGQSINFIIPSSHEPNLAAGFEQIFPCHLAPGVLDNANMPNSRKDKGHLSHRRLDLCWNFHDFDASSHILTERR